MGDFCCRYILETPLVASFRLPVVCYRTVRLPPSIHTVRLHIIRPILRAGLHDFDTVLIKYIAAFLTNVSFIDFNTFWTIYRIDGLLQYFSAVGPRPGTGSSSYNKRIYRAAVSQRLSENRWFIVFRFSTFFAFLIFLICAILVKSH
jgi:hypothetical protein